jgi:DNA polymerase-4
MAAILHIDMDAFYASVEEREQPKLKGQPVVVGGSRQRRGVVSAANYEARKFGIHSAMPAATAHRLCPHAVFLPVRIDFYARISHEIRRIFQRYTPLVEPLSLDEAFLDVTGSEGLFGSAVTIGRAIKKEIRDELNLVASVGVAPNKFLAKIASDLEKPDGFVVVDPDRIQEFLGPLPVTRLWGVGKQSNKALQRLRVKTIADLRQLPIEVLHDHFGSHGEHLWRLAHGIDDRRVVPDREAKSISHETTFAEDISDVDVLKAWLLDLTDQVARRLRRHQLRGRTVRIKVRYSDFRTITRAQSLPLPTNSTDELWRTVRELYERAAVRQPVRLLGMGVSELRQGDAVQGMLFDRQEAERQSRIDEMGDQVRDRFGLGALKRGATLGHQPRKGPAD